MGTSHRGDSMGTGSTSGGTAGTASGTADRTPTPGSMSGGLMQGSGVNTNSGTGSNATGTTGPRAMARPGGVAAGGRLEVRGADLPSILKMGPCRQSREAVPCRMTRESLGHEPEHRSSLGAACYQRPCDRPGPWFVTGALMRADGTPRRISCVRHNDCLAYGARRLW
jgi:hypothetical protein